MLADTRSELLAYARLAAIKVLPQAAGSKPPVKVCSAYQFEELQAVLKLSFQGWSAFKPDSTPGKEVLRGICAGDRDNYKRLKGG